MLIGNFNRYHMIHLLPRPAEIAEIGVAEADFSLKILELCEPRRLHLIDPWEHQGEAEYQLDPVNAASAEQSRRYDRVAARLAAPVAAGCIVLHRARSTVVRDRFADGQFDWVFVDGNHTYDGALADLRGYAAKVKPDGLILCHDHTNGIVARDLRFGVVEAVADFCGEGGWHVVALSTEAYPTVALARRQDLAAVQRLRAGLILNIPGIIEIEGYPRRLRFEHRCLTFDQERRLVPSFLPAGESP